MEKDIKNLNTYLNESNLFGGGKKKEILDLLSLKHFDYYLDIKKANNEAYKNTTLLSDIKKKYKNIFKLFLIGLFRDTLECKCYLIHKALKKTK